MIKELFDCLRKKISLCSKFFLVNRILMFYSLYRKKCVLNVIIAVWFELILMTPKLYDSYFDGYSGLFFVFAGTFQPKDYFLASVKRF